MPELKSELTASESLVAVKESQLALDPKDLTLDDVLARAKAELAAEQELKAKQEADLAAQEQAQLDRLMAVSAALMAKGYVGDGSLKDFQTLFDKDFAKFEAGVENFFSGKDPDVLALNYRGDGTNALEKLANLVREYDK